MTDTRPGDDIAALIEAKVAAAVEQAVREAVDRLRWAPRVYGDERKLHVHPTAVVNDALFNLSSGEITVEEYAFFGHGVSVLTGTHDITVFDRARQVTVPKSGRDVVIGRGAWISTNALVLGPCRIGEHAVVAAGSVVLADVEPFTVVGGTPARVLSTISERPGGTA
ncbi:acyltransferase [Pseudonocardia humida]|uniref:Acyltransferase n=1 Tax=Pseudonocardia humida TaxID=2800819 RepID=A0ABT0ZTK0_9PSEU|nr:acyltransferase [Pseudonocardia humida]MCO1654057.1 acyltransferase [Pseudonocardia humida]